MSHKQTSWLPQAHDKLNTQKTRIGPRAIPVHKGAAMATLIADLSMSLDGFVADPNDNPMELFGWMFGGDVAVPTANPDVTFQSPKASARMIREVFRDLGALVGGRRYFDLAGGWSGTHPAGVPTFIVTHSIPKGWPRPDSNIRFVTDGLDSAVEAATTAAGDKLVAIASPNIIQQLLNSGQLDAVHVNLVPVLLGEGVPFFAPLANAPVRLDGPDIIESDGVTHLTYRIDKQ
jgi:dihydrofolate reductase